MLTDTMGKALLISTPRGKNWFYALYKRGEDEEQSDYESFSFPTISSPYIPDSEVEEARQTLPEDVFAQEYGGEFLEEAAGVFHGIESCIYGEFEDPHLGQLADSVPRHRYVIGWDIAKARDFSVVSVMDCDFVREGGIVAPHLAHWERFNSLRYDVQIEKVSAIARQYDAYVLLDSTGLGDPIYDMMLSKGVPCVPYVFTTKSKQMLIQNLSIAIQTQSISYPNVPVLIQELSAFQYTVSPAGQMLYSAPEGDHDDCVISLALGTWAAQHPLWAQEQIIRERDEDDEIISVI
jgi:phage FluMu gp28-like protein